MMNLYNSTVKFTINDVFTQNYKISRKGDIFANIKFSIPYSKFIPGIYTINIFAITSLA